ncbi:MAG: ATP-binding protein [Gemmatimonadota bacterium]
MNPGTHQATDPELLVLRVPDEEAKRVLEERARELDCVVEPTVAHPRSRVADRIVPESETGGSPPGLRLDEASALCQALLEGTRDEVLVADEGGRVTFVSSRLAELAELEPDEVAGGPANRILSAIGLPGFESLRGMLTTVSCARQEAEIVDSDGKSRPVLLRGVSTRLSGGRRRFVWFITELSRVRSVERANRILRSELETQSRLLALVSHELRTPLNIVLGQLSILQTGLRGELTEEQLDSVVRSERASQSLLSLINDLIDFARLETEELELELVPFRVDDLVDEVMEVGDTLLAESHLRIEAEYDDGAPLTVVGDPDRTRQILIQLLTNAVKFSDEGTIRLCTRPVEDAAAESDGALADEADFLALDVRDSGIGIPHAELERVFEPFHQTSHLLNREREGTGLGLSIARRLARRQGGDLVAAHNEQRGSVFTLYLRLAGGEQAIEPSAGATSRARAAEPGGAAGP